MPGETSRLCRRLLPVEEARYPAGGDLVPAAVLVPIVQHPSTTVLLTRRTDHLDQHAGQISFPGGQAEEMDTSPVATALRESQEEIGVEPSRVKVAGTLPLYPTVTGFAIVPVVGLIGEDLQLRIDEDEVAEVFEVPLSFVLDPASYARHEWIYRGRPRQFWSLTYSGHFIWGATAGMLHEMCSRYLREPAG